MREFPRDYDHCFLGNGTDGVLVGYTGAMVPERVNAPERCVWYKSDRYYPRERPAAPVPHRHYRKEITRIPRADDTWFELAPLGRSWYEVLDEDGRPLTVTAFSQRYDPLSAVLRSSVRFGAIQAQVTTFLHASLPLLVVHCTLDRSAWVRAIVAPGPWSTSDEEPDPFTSLTLTPGEVAQASYALGELVGKQALWLDRPPDRFVAGDGWLGLERDTAEVTIFHAITDRRDRVEMDEVARHTRHNGFDGLLAEHQATWRTIRGRSCVRLPDDGLQRLYDAGITLFRAIQSPESGGIPVGLLRQTWSSHLFWDAYFPARALLEAGRVEAALAQCDFLLRTVRQAGVHARSAFGVDGLAWDWELTHDGRRAYGADWEHLSEQVHNTAAYSNLLFDSWRFTQDRTLLARIGPALAGIADFFERAVIEPRGTTFGTRPLVGVHESAIRVRDDAFNLAGAIRVFENAATTADRLGESDPRIGRWRTIAERLRPSLDGLYDGRMFRSYAGARSVTMSSLAPTWPMEVVAPGDRRSRATARAFARSTGFLAGGGWPRAIWPAAILARLFASMGQGDRAADILGRCLWAMNCHGGVAERIGDDGRWNLQYFSTAHGALCSAIHALLLLDDGESLRLFPALPAHWKETGFERLLSGGLEVSAQIEDGRIGPVEIANRSDQTVSRLLKAGRRRHLIRIRPGDRITVPARPRTSVTSR